ncbi:ABC transporter substrate-binding protein [Zobellella endophytica]|uniref:ABC transporter substrate-binding protein n=1 Tax=Zobellella endophytica TaxID=2116700 RepID=A0A2P7RC50_9GAMM|nr:ABC transporter substrate-binding protein [Zobellella endophytica]PSJ47732.1 ABC transporter substrate-binding protein [Zobellella endophytica]
MKGLVHGMRLAVCGLAVVAATQAMAEEQLIKGNIRLVIGSTSTGGDTYQNASIIAEELAKKLDVNVKVDAVGTSAAFKALARGASGNTLMFFHDQSYLGNLYGIRGYDDIFTEYKVGPMVSINPGDAFLTPKNSPYQTVEDIVEAVGQDKQVRVAIQPGGVSEIGYSALKNAVILTHPGKEDNLVAVNTGSQSDKNQLLFDGQADLIHGSVQANEQYTRLPADDQKAMSFAWLMAREGTLAQANEEGFGQTNRDALLGYAEPNISVTLNGTDNFTFDKEFFFIYNKDIKPEIVEYLDQALTEIYAEGQVQQTFKKNFFIPNFMASAESERYLKEKATTYQKVIQAIQ